MQGNQKYIDTESDFNDGDNTYLCEPVKNQGKDLLALFQSHSPNVPPVGRFITPAMLTEARLSGKGLILESKSINSKQCYKENIGRVLRSQTEGYLKPSGSNRKITGSFEIVEEIETGIFIQALKVIEAIRSDPNQVFMPSKELVDMIRNGLETPDEEFKKSVEAFNEFMPDDLTEESDFGTIVSEDIEGFLSSLAGRTKTFEKPIQISLGDRFTREIDLELITRLELDPHNPRFVLTLLHNELLNFASTIDRKREWGTITVEDGIIKLRVEESALDYPDFNEAGDENWITTK